MESTLQGQLKSWRQHLHQYPETGFEEVDTSDYVANILATLGLDVHRGIGGTGLVANLTVGSGKRAIGLRADTTGICR
jgi:hippurate hydrolase